MSSLDLTPVTLSALDATPVTAGSSSLAGPSEVGDIPVWDGTGYDFLNYWFDVRSYGAVGDGVTNDTAACQACIDAAEAAGGGIVFFGAGTYLVSGLEVRDSSGVTLRGAGRAATKIHGNASAAVIINVISAVGSGSVSNVNIEDMRVSYTASSPSGAIALQLWNGLHMSMRNVMLYGGTGAAGVALNIHGSGNLIFDNVQAYGGSGGGRGVVMGTGGGTLTSTGPLVWNGGQIGSGGGATGLDIEANTFDATFNSPYVYANGAGMAAAVKINGLYTSVVFNGWYGESKYNTANTGVDMLIGNVAKPASVILNGTQQWGHGNSTNYQLYAIQIDACKLFICRGGSWSKLGATNGYNGGIFRLTTNPAAGDRWVFETNEKGDTAGPLYSVAAAATSFADVTTAYTGDLNFPVGLNVVGPLTFGSAGDVNLYRNAAANELKTDDTLEAAQEIYARHGSGQAVGLGLLGPGSLPGIQLQADTTLYRSAANVLRTPGKILVDDEIELDGALNHDGTTVGFYGTAPVAKQTGVAVTAAGVHAALVNLGLISA